MNEWNIQSRAHGCQACGRHFVDKQPYHTVLQDHRREVQRLDLCEACWKEGHAEGASSRQGFISMWQGVYEQPPAAPPEAIRKENAETLLRKIIERNDPAYAAAGYILAAMLERKRLLKVKEQFKRDGRRVFVYEQPKTGDIFTITDPELQLNQLEQVQRVVGELLEHGFPGDAPAVTPSPATDAAPDAAMSTADGADDAPAPGGPADDSTGGPAVPSGAAAEPGAIEAPVEPTQAEEPVAR